MPTTTLVTMNAEGLTALADRIDALTQVFTAAFAPRALPRTLPPHEPCDCGMCTAQRSMSIQGIYVIPGDAPSDDAARISLMAVLHGCTPFEVTHVRSALRDGVLEGCSTNGCVLARIASCRGLSYQELREQWGATDIESWVMAHIHYALTPENDAHAALLDEWLTTWLDDHTAVHPRQLELVTRYQADPFLLDHLPLSSFVAISLRE